MVSSEEFYLLFSFLLRSAKLLYSAAIVQDVGTLINCQFESDWNGAETKNMFQPTECSLWDGRRSFWSETERQLCCMLILSFCFKPTTSFHL